ncbi:MAG TPA: hypothetical protein PKE16_04175, partial [Hyphomicrobium sp.]|nr:hypothetical protein [Hyphomicrobium sp.]
WQASLWNPGLQTSSPNIFSPRMETPSLDAPSCFVLANNYLHSDIAEKPLPAVLLDRLADLYWTERDAELAI